MVLDSIMLENPYHRVASWNLVSTKGPLIDNQDQLTAYYIVKCNDQNWAYVVANQLLGFHVKAVEVRRIHPKKDFTKNHHFCYVFC